MLIVQNNNPFIRLAQLQKKNRKKGEIIQQLVYARYGHSRSLFILNTFYLYVRRINDN